MSPARFTSLALFVIVLALSGRATAHQLGRSYCNVQTVTGGIDVTVETAVPHLAPLIGVPATASDAELLAKRALLERALRAAVTARTPSGQCSASADAPELSQRDGSRSVAMTLHFECPPGEVTLHNAWRLELDPSSEVVCAVNGSAWAFRLGSEERVVGTPPTLGEVLGSFVKLGMHHVASGIDHVLFVIALLLAAARASRVYSLARGMRGMAAVVTGFTLGHSVTLIAAGLDLIRLEPRITESVIALSIVVVSVENVLREVIRWRSITAMLFGLVHGFGFASVLADTELPPRATVRALVAFNVGIELAQLVIVILVFPPLALAARRAWYERRLLRPVSILIATVASLWFFKRAFQLDFWPWLGS
jgi:HupE / UreJ protein